MKLILSTEAHSISLDSNMSTILLIFLFKVFNSYLSFSFSQSMSTRDFPSSLVSVIALNPTVALVARTGLVICISLRLT